MIIQCGLKISLALSVGFNASDTTFGWHGFHDGFQIYYKHFTHVLEDQAHSVLLYRGSALL